MPTTPCRRCSSFVSSRPTTSCRSKLFRIGNVQVLYRLGRQLLVWATIPDWKCINFVASGCTIHCLGAQFSIGNVQFFPHFFHKLVATLIKMLRANYVHWGAGAHNSGLEMFKFCRVWAHISLSGPTIPDWKCSNFVKFSINWGQHY